ncbi:MAG: PASTA domain-containing protein [Acidobacteriaceae bacterium]|nr:PASTA domain-containing protein [Acidobacteriaceae bacterium]
MATALRKIGVPPDMPEDIEVLLAKQKKGRDNKPIKETDVADLTTPFSEEEIREANGDALLEGAVVLAEADPNAPKVPNFVGKTVRDVVQEAASNGLDVNLSGEGLARTQTPPAGALLLPDAHIYVRFDH